MYNLNELHQNQINLYDKNFGVADLQNAIALAGLVLYLGIKPNKKLDPL
jgi:hypothetical protein